MKTYIPTLTEKKEYRVLTVSLGDLYFFENYLVTEFNEGENVTFKNFKEVSEAIKEHYGNSPIGFIANRVNSYSIDLSDHKLLNNGLTNIKAYAVIVHKPMSKQIFEIENHFFNVNGSPSNRKSFSNIKDAMEWVEGCLSDFTD